MASGGYDSVRTVCVVHIALVGVDGCFTSALTVFIDVLGTAEVLRPVFDCSIPFIRVDVVGARRKVVTGAGLTVPVTMSLTDLDCFDTIVIPALGTLTEHDTTEALKGRDVRAVTRALGRIDHAAAIIAAACTGVFALAETSLLDQHCATTSWWLRAAFRGRYPTVSLDLDAMVVSTTDCVCNTQTGSSPLQMPRCLCRRSGARRIGTSHGRTQPRLVAKVGRRRPFACFW